MKKQRAWSGWSVCAAVFIGLGTLLQAQAQTTSSQDALVEDDEYYIEWIVPELPPYPPVVIEGKVMTWEEAFGPLPKPEPIAVKRPKNPKPPQPYDPQKRWLEIKRRLAPQLFDENGKPTETGEQILNQRAARQKAFESAKARSFRPKYDPHDPRLLTGNRAIQLKAAGASRNGPEGDDPDPEPRLELVEVTYVDALDSTYAELWLIDGPQNEWWEIFRAPVLDRNAWYPAYIGEPSFVFDNIQIFPVWFAENASESYFQIFLYQDSDYDGLTDGLEIAMFKTDPLNPDSDSMRDEDGDGQPDNPNLGGNGIADGDEDWDNDGLSNLYELQIVTDPFGPQNSSIDTDSDGLPDWLEQLITYWTGDPDPAPGADSDGDGINNITEWQLRTDPSWPFEWIWASFASLPDHNRVMEHLSLELEPETLAPLGFREESEIPADAYFDASFGGYHGTAAQLTVLKDTDANGNYAPGVDTFKFAAAYQTPPNFVPTQNIPPPGPNDGNVEDHALLIQVTSIGGSTGANVWKAAKVNDLLNTLSEPTLIHIQHRSFQRMWVRFRRLQLLMVAQEMPDGIRLRVRPIVAEIHTQATIMRNTTLTLGQRYPSTQALARVGRFVPAAGAFCSVLALPQNAIALVQAYATYMRDVKLRCDNNEDNALDLAVALSNIVDAAFPAPVNSALLWPIWWNALSNFDGWSSSC